MRAARDVPLREPDKVGSDRLDKMKIGRRVHVEAIADRAEADSVNPTQRDKKKAGREERIKKPIY